MDQPLTVIDPMKNKGNIASSRTTHGLLPTKPRADLETIRRFKILGTDFRVETFTDDDERDQR
jgi:hypothetical protein